MNLLSAFFFTLGTIGATILISQEWPEWAVRAHWLGGYLCGSALTYAIYGRRR